MKFLIPILLATIPSMPGSDPGIHEDLAPVPLCRALESLRPGDQIPVVVSGIFVANYFFDPSAVRCQMDVAPSTCVEFGPDVVFPEGFLAIHDFRNVGRVAVTFRGTLFGPRLIAEAVPPSKSLQFRRNSRMGASNNLRYCSHFYRTKLVVESILSFGPVPAGTPSLEEQKEAPEIPVPLEIKPPKYPPVARMIDYEGKVLLKVNVEGGRVVEAKPQFGDPVVVDASLANIFSWRFAPDVSFTFTVEYDYRLENRTLEQGKTETVEMRLPFYIRVTGKATNF